MMFCKTTIPGLVVYVLFLLFMLDVVGLVSQYHSQAIGFKDLSNVTSYVSRRSAQRPSEGDTFWNFLKLIF